MLERLRPRTFLRVDHEQEEVDPGRAGDHRADEALVARHVDEREPAAVRQLERRVAEVDRDAARLLLGQAVGVLAGERPHEPRLAVVDVAGGADRQRHARTAAATSSTLVVRERAAVEQQAAVADDPDHRRLVPAQRFRERLSSIAQANDGSSASGSAPPPTRATVSSTSPPTAAARRSARARTAARVLVQHPQHRDLAQRAVGLEVEQQRSFERGEAELVDAQRAVQRMAAQPLDRGRRGRRRSPACGPPSSLSPLKQTRSAPAASASARGRLVGEVERARRSRDRRAAAGRAARATAASSAHGRLLGEADDAEVRLVHAQEQRGLARDRALVVGGARAVRRADLDQARARAREHVRDAEAVADLDQLAARDEHLAALGERREREQHRRRRCC